MFVSLLTSAITAGVLGLLWVLIGPTGFVFAWVTHFILMVWASKVVGPHTRIPDYGWLRVRRWEPRLYGILGVRVFGKLLDAIGWNRIIANARAFDGTRQGLDSLDQHTRRSELGHIMCLLVSAALATGIAGTESWAGALWLIGLGVPLHLYPVLLQRVLRSRIQELPVVRAASKQTK